MIHAQQFQLAAIQQLTNCPPETSNRPCPQDIHKSLRFPSNENVLLCTFDYQHVVVVVIDNCRQHCNMPSHHRSAGPPFRVTIAVVPLELLSAARLRFHDSSITLAGVISHRTGFRPWPWQMKRKTCSTSLIKLNCVATVTLLLRDELLIQLKHCESSSNFTQSPRGSVQTGKVNNRFIPFGVAGVHST